jgi:predicted phage terminase large subunit-like protein
MEQIRPTPKQREAARIAASKLITLYGGAIRGGKSYWLLLMIFTYAMKYDKSRWAVIRASYTTLKSTLLVTFNKLLSEGLSPYVATFNHSDLVVTLTNGSQIIFFAENYDNDKELNRFRGLEVNGFGIDELNEIQKVTFNKCIERAGSWQGSANCPIKILATCNPSDNWVKEDFYDKWDTNELPHNWAYVPSKITDNPHISKEYLESLKSLPEDDYEQFVNGNWNLKREGSIFDKRELREFVPDPNRTFETSIAYADVADEGKDSNAVVFGRNIGKDIYITDVSFSKENSDVTIPLVFDRIKTNDCKYIRIESNNMGAMYGRNLRTLIATNKHHCQVYSASSTTNKHTRILMDIGFIKTHCLFLAPEYQNEEYKAFMKELTSYNKDPEKNKGKHDDAPDSLSGLVIFIRSVLIGLYR